MRRVCRLMQHSCGSARCQRSCVGKSPPHHLRPRSAKVEFNLAAIPPHLCRDESRQKCSGQQGSSRPGCWRRQCQSSLQGTKTFVLAAPPRCPSQTAPACAPHQRRSQVPQFDVQCQFAKTVVPRITVITRSPLWAVPAQGAEGVCPTRKLSVFAGGREPKVSRPWSRQSPPPPHTRPPSRPTLHCVPRPWSLGDSKPGLRPNHIKEKNGITRITHPP